MQFLLNLIAFCTCLVSACADLYGGKISNWITVPAIVVSLGIVICFGTIWEGIDWQWTGLSTLFLVLCLPVLLVPGGLGGGDFKLILMLIITLGIPRAMLIVILTALSGAIAISLRPWYTTKANQQARETIFSASKIDARARGSEVVLGPFFAVNCVVVLFAEYLGGFFGEYHN